MLTPAEIIEKYENPKHQIHRLEAIEIENWTSYFVLPEFGANYLPAPKKLREVLAQMATPEKADRLLLYAFDNNEMTALFSDMLDDLSKVFRAKDRYENLILRKTSSTTDEALADVRLKAKKFIANRNDFEKNVLKRWASRPHTFVLFEVEEDGSLEVEFIEVDKLVEFEEENNQIKWAIFKDDKTLYYYDDVYYIEINIEKKTSEIVKHLFDVCPVNRISWERLRPNNDLLVKTPFVANIGRSIEAFTSDLKHRYSKDYSAFPIMIAPKQDCNFTANIGENGEHSVYCGGGNLYVRNSSQVYTGINNGKCPVCSITSSPGTLISYELPKNNENIPNDPVKFINADIDALEFQSKSLKEKIEVLKYSILGKGGDLNMNQAQNENQIFSAYESRIQALEEIKSVIEPLMQWIFNTAFSRMFGEAFEEYIYNLGSEFIVFTSKELEIIFKAQKEAGMSQSVLFETQKNLVYSQNQNNPIKANAAILKLYLEPFPTMSLKEVIEMSQVQVGGASLVKPEDITLKANFSQLLQKYESEVLPLESETIENLDSIKQKLYEYAIR